MATDTAKVLETLGKMTVLELVELKNAIEEEWGVTAAAPMAVAAPGAAAPGAPAEAAEEKSAFDVVITAAGDKKIQVIKVVRAVTGLGLKEAKDLVDGAPGTVKEGANQEEADSIKAQLEEAGASVELKYVPRSGPRPFERVGSTAGSASWGAPGPFLTPFGYTPRSIRLPPRPLVAVRGLSALPFKVRRRPPYASPTTHISSLAVIREAVTT